MPWQNLIRLPHPSSCFDAAIAGSMSPTQLTETNSRSIHAIISCNVKRPESHPGFWPNAFCITAKCSYVERPKSQYFQTPHAICWPFGNGDGSGGGDDAMHFAGHAWHYIHACLTLIWQRPSARRCTHNNRGSQRKHMNTSRSRVHVLMEAYLFTGYNHIIVMLSEKCVQYRKGEPQFGGTLQMVAISCCILFSLRPQLIVSRKRSIGSQVVNGETTNSLKPQYRKTKCIWKQKCRTRLTLILGCLRCARLRYRHTNKK